jgi:hypothetical protein
MHDKQARGEELFGKFAPGELNYPAEAERGAARTRKGLAKAKSLNRNAEDRPEDIHAFNGSSLNA